MPLVLSPNLTKTANGEDMYLRVNENGDVVVPRNLEVLGNTVLDGTLEAKGAVTFDSTLLVKGETDLSGAVSMASNANIAGKLLVAGHGATGVDADHFNKIGGNTEINADTTDPTTTKRGGLLVRSGGVVVDEIETLDNGATFVPIFNQIPYLKGIFAGFNQITSIPAGGNTNLESLYVMTFGTSMRVAWGKTGVITSHDFNNSSIPQIPANTVPGGQQLSTGLFTSTSLIVATAQGVNDTFGLINCATVDANGAFSGNNPGDLTKTKAYFIIIGVPNSA